MSGPEVELARLRGVCPRAELWTEGGRAVAFLPDVEFPAGAGRARRDLLLWPFERDGYSSRLFLSAKLDTSPANNWNVFSIQGREWHACSWQGVPNTLPWIEMLANHLRAFA